MFWIGWKIDVPVLEWVLMIGGFFVSVVLFVLWIFRFGPKEDAEVPVNREVTRPSPAPNAPADG